MAECQSAAPQPAKTSVTWLGLRQQIDKVTVRRPRHQRVLSSSATTVDTSRDLDAVIVDSQLTIMSARTCRRLGGQLVGRILLIRFSDIDNCVTQTT